ncbi:SDR family oxidoreductase [Pelagibacteraceae bacterium]|nr:SDR family oxidoreductase [Pelagibacteraceae bacterium]
MLLEKGYKVTVYDLMYFGNEFLPKDNPNLTLIKGDIRDQNKLKTDSKNHDIFLHLACISNDTSFALDEKLSTTINYDAFKPMVEIAKNNGIQRFIYASTSSVYGISEKKNVTEEHPLVPLTLYNKYKGMCEPQLLELTDDNFYGVIFRPATVCGYSPRQRLDLSVNILTNFAVNKKFIKVFGGDQLRPNLHILDYCDVVELLINADKEKIRNQIFNVGYQNLSILEIAQKVKKVVQNEFPKIGEINIEMHESDDKRSYHINSDKIKTILNFQPNHSIEDAISELCSAFKNNLLPNSFDNDNYFNVKKLQNLRVK